MFKPLENKISISNGFHYDFHFRNFPFLSLLSNFPDRSNSLGELYYVNRPFGSPNGHLLEPTITIQIYSNNYLYS